MRDFVDLRSKAMRVILVANSKGGAGKTTLSTNIAGYFAATGARTVLADWDTQKSAANWLARRPAAAPAIALWDANVPREKITQFKPEVMVIDSPAALHGAELIKLAERANRVVVPVMTSAFDIEATARFLKELQNCAAGKSALVGMRIDGRYKSAGDLDEFLAEVTLPVITHLRNTQNYVQCARDGLSIFELPRSKAEYDWEQWAALTSWLVDG
jgi:chromosome partitioning protein